MSAKLPPPPELPPQAPASWLAIALVFMIGAGLAVVLTALSLGYVGVIILVGAAIFLMIGVQYLLWGWLFERIYRSQPRQDDQSRGRD